MSHNCWPSGETGGNLQAATNLIMVLIRFLVVSISNLRPESLAIIREIKIKVVFQQVKIPPGGRATSSIINEWELLVKNRRTYIILSKKSNGFPLA